MTLGSLFDGSGGFPLAGLIHGIEPIWASEIEAYPIAVTKARLPNMKHLGDVMNINGAEIEPVDIITAGFPCQDASVAGKRLGFDGKRTVLFYEAARIIREMLEATNGEYPKYLLFENVPGILSVHGGEDFCAIMDELTDMGFIADVNILDAQYMGVPQRRRRVYFLCTKADNILHRRTIISESITLQLLTELLLVILVEALKASGVAPKNSAVLGVLQRENGRAQRMKLFSLHKEENLVMLRENLTDIQRKFVNVHENWGEKAGADQMEVHMWTKGDMQYTDLDTGQQSWSIEQLLNWILDENLHLQRSSITSTSTSRTTTQIICTCVRALLFMQEYTVHFVKYVAETAPRQLYCLQWALSISTEVKEFMKNARQKYRKSPECMGWYDVLVSSEQKLSACGNEFKRCFGNERAAILFERESLQRHTSQSGEAWQGVASDTQRSSGRSGNTRGIDDHSVVYSLDSLSSNSMKSNNPHSGFHEATIAKCLDTSDGNPCKNQGGNVVVQKSAAFMAGQGAKAYGIGYQEEVSPTLKSTPSGMNTVPSIVYALQGNGIGRSDTAGCDGRGWREGQCYTLNTIDRPAVVYDAHDIVTFDRAAFNQGENAQYEPEIRTDGICSTLVARGPSGVCFPIDQHQQDSRFKICEDGIVPTMTSHMGTGGNNTPMILEKPVCVGNGQLNQIAMKEVTNSLDCMHDQQAVLMNGKPPRKYIIRRLSPLECCRLQGYPDWWIDGVQGSDSAKYKMFGNAIAIPCASFVLGGIAKQLSQEVINQ